MLVDNGLAETRAKAQALIISGSVLVDGVVRTKAGHAVRAGSSITLKERMPYVSRGGLKLESAMKSFNAPCGDKICMDIGASTGGFTDYMLKNGARKVYAVDVGRGQLHPSLKSDPRVKSIEGVNFRYFSDENLKGSIEFCTIDVSFISLERILPPAVACMKAGADLIAMVKPQFESSPADLRKGVVRDEKVRRKAIKKIADFSEALGLTVVSGVDSKVKGPKGNVEHFLWLKKAL